LVLSVFKKNLMHGKPGFFLHCNIRCQCHKLYINQKRFMRKTNMRKTSSSSIKIAEVGSLFDIFSWPSLKPGSISAIKVKGTYSFFPQT
jgi:hypothetical protein